MQYSLRRDNYASLSMNSPEMRTARPLLLFACSTFEKLNQGIQETFPLGCHQRL